MNKVINSRCICGSSLSKYKDELIVILSCQHLIHNICAQNIENNKCPYCDKHIKNILTQKEVSDIVEKTGHPMYYQIHIDMSTLKNISNQGSINWFVLFCRFPGIFDNLGEVYLSKNRNDINFAMREFLDICNFEIKIINKHKIIDDTKVIISNHVNNLDSVPIYSVFDCGFLASSLVNKKWLSRKVSKFIPLIIIDRNKSKNTLGKIKEYMRKNGDICIFPEGLITHPKTLARFRTGAFHLGYPIQPIIMTYSQNISDSNFKNFLMKVYSQKKIVITVTILDPIHPPFEPDIHEFVRHKMAEAGNMALSRVSNRDIIEN